MAANSNADLVAPNFGIPTIDQGAGVLRKPNASVTGYWSGDGNHLRAAEKLTHETLGKPVGLRIEGRNAGMAVNG